jgi:hydroxypyruvate isomerase
MENLAANLSMLFTEYEFLDRFEAATNAGFKGVEYLFPYPFEPDVLAGKLQENNLVQISFNLPAGDWDAGDRGIACIHPEAKNFEKEWKKPLAMHVY